ncbi:MAG TPA: hypothetical protein VM537_27715, partial [Anaerolineae bacterium]|nr:hypothetical protein [Anaerolineae bacterium]
MMVHEEAGAGRLPVGCRIRPATEQDMPAIDAINRCAWGGGITTHELLEQRHGLIDGLPWVERMTAAATVHLARSDVAVFVARCESRVVGYAAAQMEEEDQASDIGIISYN